MRTLTAFHCSARLVRLGLPLFVATALSPALFAKEAAPAPLESGKPASSPAAAPKDDSASLRKPLPESVADLIAIEQRVKGLVDKLAASTVSVRIGRAQGSGVIVTKDGYILTAAHVIGASGQDVRVTLSDGREVRGESLGLDKRMDAGMIKITDKGEWPAAEMAADDSYAPGHWCVAIGHPNGYQKDRGTVLRLGRVLSRRDLVQTDCTLVGGDSGGPLYDLDGRVIGIHSRIGVPTAFNFHVPISAYRREWDRLVKGEEIGRDPEEDPRADRPRDPPPPGTAQLGVDGEDGKDGCRITRVPEGFAAADAGLKTGDVVTRFDGAKVDNFKGLLELVLRRSPGDKVDIELMRDGKPMTVTAVLGKRK